MFRYWIMRKYFNVSIIIIIAFLAIIASFNTPAEAGSIWLVVGDPLSTPQSGSIFETELQFSTWDAVMGAYSISVHYDPDILQILQVTVPADSEFYGNTFADEDSFSFGITDISAFQFENWHEQMYPVTFATIQWQVMGTSNTFTTVALETGSMIDYFWRPIEVNASDITVTVMSECTTWSDVISIYNNYVSGNATWEDVISTYNQYVNGPC